ncbi:LuxR family transcriptional regulator [Rhodobacter aestuarii]|uniref:LuxR family transcriptional regulator n=1 Tax=Rhodobacter aestuarii TaxID=453582 RepID=A0A1N7JC51_9RHOB|nr:MULTISPECIES: LuxR family transcriptional regulator [Rhodobacter]PTV96952.1 LuxR family transcriptional regulator [Rhodobacter aestuarii]SIS46854.1 LuxR family transcriptional regulator [Rhodobacter aestuarii]SOB98151.1 LuxR family transcriptional regulator [Rhodobacter sp. JA431]
MLGHLENLLAVEDIAGLWSLHCDRMASFGFDRLIYGFTRFRTPHIEGNLDDTLVLSNHDPEYLKAFLGDKLFSQAPMVKWAAESNGAQSWRLVAERASAGLLSDEEKKVIALNQRFEVLAGYSIGFPDTSTRAKGAIGLCARPGLSQDEVDAIWNEHGRELWVLNSVLHLKISSLPFPAQRRPLTARQREVLEWVSDGKTTADIAQIMGVTQATVEKHLRLARETLEVETTAQAVLKAALQKQLFLTKY